MNRISNPLFMILPEELIGTVMLFMIVIGGFLIMVGARTKGWTLVVSAIAIPFIAVLVEALMNAFFDSLPEHLILPVAWFIMFATYAFGAMIALRLFFGDKAIEEAKGQLLADAVKWALKLLFKWPVMLVWVGTLVFFSLKT